MAKYENKTPVRVEVTVNHQRPKCWQVWIEGGASPENNVLMGDSWKSIWVPNFAVIETDCLAEGDKGYIVLQQWVLDKNDLVPAPPKQTTTDEMTELEDQLQEAHEDSDRLEVVLGVDPDKLPYGQGDIQINAYLTDEGLVVDVYHDGSEEAIASGYELFSEAGLHPPAPIEDEEEDF